jgi:hypothetical protein
MSKISICPIKPAKVLLLDDPPAVELDLATDLLILTL